MRSGARLAAVAFGAALLACAAPAGAERRSTPHFFFQAHANNVRVRPPLVGPWQLGTANIHGSGLAVGGRYVAANDPLYSRYPAASIRAEAVAYSYFAAAHGAFKKLTLTIEVTSSSDQGHCATGTRGTMVLYDSPAKLSNGERADYVTVRWPAHECLGFVQGWTNEDGGARTSPSHGGPPHGGQWAIVRIT